MSIGIVSTVNKTADGTITVPVGCLLIYALVKGSEAPPVIEGVAMAPVSSTPAAGVNPALSIHQYPSPAITDLAFTFTGTNVHFIFFSAAESFRPGSMSGYSATGTFTADMVTSTADVALGIMYGSVGPTTLKGDTIAMTYLVDTTNDKVGWIVPGDLTLTGEAQDTGTSAGYWIVTPVIHHPAVLLSRGYWEYKTIYHPGYWETKNVWVPGYYGPDGVWVPGHWLQQTTWHPPYTTIEEIWHPDVWQPAWDEDPPDIWVPPGPAQVSACFCSVRLPAGAGFVSRPNIFG